ncbi:hypothetical protein M2158_002712 [Streptomyces sp. SAI-144]|nr:hypothetical protein [Streptomyces sp. SAI-144]
MREWTVRAARPANLACLRSLLTDTCEPQDIPSPEADIAERRQWADQSQGVGVARTRSTTSRAQPQDRVSPAPPWP